MGIPVLAKAAQLPHDLATAVTDEFAHQAEEVLTNVSHRAQPPDPSQLYYESSIQREQHQGDHPADHESRPEVASAADISTQADAQQSGGQPAGQVEASNSSREREDLSIPCVQDSANEELPSSGGRSAEEVQNGAADQIAEHYVLQHEGQLYAKDLPQAARGYGSGSERISQAAAGYESSSDGRFPRQSAVVPGDQIDPPSQRFIPGSASSGSSSSVSFQLISALFRKGS